MENPVDTYIETFPEPVRAYLQEIRTLIREVAPEAEECLNYNIPTFKLKGNLVHFAGYKKHIGFYPTPSAMSAFDAELSGYKRAKGSVQFPLDQPLPIDLIRRMVEFRVKENLGK